MDKKYGILIICAVILFLCTVGTASAKTWYVDDSGGANFTRIQDALTTANEGDTITVRDGNYLENVKVNKSLTIQSENGSALTVVQAANPDDHVFNVTVGYVNISGFTVKGATGGYFKAGIYLYYADQCNMTYNNCSNNEIGISAGYSNNNAITGNTVTDNNRWGVKFFSSGNNVIAGNNLSNNYGGFYLYPSSNNNTTTGNAVSNNTNQGIEISSSSNNNTVTGNNISNNSIVGVYIRHSSNNKIYLNNFVNNTDNIDSTNSTNIWNSTEEITYTYNGTMFTNYLGNYWDDYTDIDVNNDGIWDNLCSIDSDWDYHPLVEPFENYPAPTENIFDTGAPSNPYPSIMGNHTGTIKPNHTVIATKIYTYPCIGTGGHTEYAEIRNATWNATATWEGYIGDWHNLTLDKTVVLLTNKTYNYIIRTGSYPQIIHEQNFTTLDGSFINCTEFTDANGRKYNNWIPAIRLH